MFQMRQSELLQQIPDAGILLPAGESGQLQHHPNIVGYRQLTKHRSFLRKISNSEAAARVNRQSAELLVFQLDRSLLRLDEPEHHVEGGRLACTVAA